MNRDFKIKSVIGLILLLVVITATIGVYASRLKEEYTISVNNNYNEAFINLVNYMNNVENSLAKSMITKSPEHGAENMTKIWRDANLASVYLSRIPFNSEGLSQTEKFLNQVSDYSYSLSRKTINNQELSEEDFTNIKTLYNYSVELQNTLNQLSDELFNGTITWDNLKANNNLEFAQTVDNVSILSNLDQNLNEYEGLIYDGAYSDHVNKVEKKGLTGDDVNEEEAKERIKTFLGSETIEDISANGFLENADIQSYDFSVKLKDKNNKINVSVSKKGGHIIQTYTDREVTKENISQWQANEIGKKYLLEKEYGDMKETYYMKQNNIITINYAFDDNGIIVYPDLIKVKIALDNGEILGVEATGYMNSHTQREYNNINTTMELAKEKLNKNLNVKSEGMAVIPTKWKTEVLCYEFKGEVEGKEFLVYINAETGEEQDVLVIINTPDGILTM